jgi:hypothetical protein
MDFRREGKRMELRLCELCWGDAGACRRRVFTFLHRALANTYPSRKGGGVDNGNCLIVIFVLQTFTPCLPTVKKWFKNATATSTE